MKNTFENYFLNFYFLNVLISLVIQVQDMTFCIDIGNIVVVGTVSQIFDIGPGSIFMKLRINNDRK